MSTVNILSNDYVGLLQELSSRFDIQVRALDDESCLIQFDEKSWRLWPSEGCWIELNSVGHPVGEMHHGTIANFNEKHILANSFLPKNHSKKWSINEKKKLQELIAMDLSIAEIAKQMGRSHRSIVAKSALVLGVNFDHILVSKSMPRMTIKSLVETRNCGSSNLGEK